MDSKPPLWPSTWNTGVLVSKILHSGCCALVTQEDLEGHSCCSDVVRSWGSCRHTGSHVRVSPLALLSSFVSRKALLLMHNGSSRVLCNSGKIGALQVGSLQVAVVRADIHIFYISFHNKARDYNLLQSCHISALESNQEKGRGIDQRHKCREKPGSVSMFPAKRSSCFSDSSGLNLEHRAQESQSYPQTSQAYHVRGMAATGVAGRRWRTRDGVSTLTLGAAAQLSGENFMPLQVSSSYGTWLVSLFTASRSALLHQLNMLTAL